MPFWSALICLAAFIMLLALVVSLMIGKPVEDTPDQLSDAGDIYLIEMSNRVLAANTQARREGTVQPFHGRSD